LISLFITCDTIAARPAASIARWAGWSASAFRHLAEWRFDKSLYINNLPNRQTANGGLGTYYHFSPHLVGHSDQFTLQRYCFSSLFVGDLPQFIRFVPESPSSLFLHRNT